MSADQEQHTRNVANLHAKEGAFAQRETEGANAIAAEEARLVEQANGLELQRAELKNAEREQEAERVQAQQGEFCIASLHSADVLSMLPDACSICCSFHACLQ